jgi:hypothetical protein
LVFEALMPPTLNTYQYNFSSETVSLAASPLSILTHLLPTVAGVPLDVLGNREVQFFVIPILADFSSVLRNVVSVTLAVFLII